MSTSPSPHEPLLFGELGDRPDGARVGMHWHDEGELSWVSAGTQRLLTDRGIWVTPRQYAVWVPGNIAHDGFKNGDGSFHWIKFHPAVALSLPSHPCAVRVTPTLEAALRQTALAECPPLAEARELLAVFRAELADARLPPVLMPLSQPGLLKPIIARLEHTPADERPLAEWASFLRISESTLSRAFQQRLGISFRDFRHSVRLLAALEGLAEEQEVGVVARALGYRSVSMFVELFRKRLGVTPARYFAA